MGRPIEFDLEKARQSAMLLFWRKGYLASSLSDLLLEMKITRGSFYAAFGDKRTLFMDCLDLFAERTHQMLARTRASHAPVDALQRFMERSFLREDGAHSALGCMLVNTVIELSAVDEDIRARASGHLDELQKTFATCFREAGHTPARSAELAAFLMLVNEGVRVSSRRNLTRRKQLDQIETAFRLLRSAAA